MEIKCSDIATAPNAISATGFGLVVDGTQHRGLDTWSGLLETAAGRMLDLADGKVARMTGQSSEFGAAVDATLDKLAGFAIVAEEWRKDTAPKLALTAMVGQNIVNALATAKAAKAHPNLKLEPSTAGKRAMAAQNIALAAYGVAGMVKAEHPEAHRQLRWAGHVATIVGVGYFGTKATRYYLKRAK